MVVAELMDAAQEAVSNCAMPPAMVDVWAQVVTCGAAADVLHVPRVGSELTSVLLPVQSGRRAHKRTHAHTHAP
jgi:hypothetical protein